MTYYQVTEDTLADAFTEWEKDYVLNPEDYADEHGDPVDYGRACARHLLGILRP